MPCRLQLETTANKVLCAGSEFTVILRLFNDGAPFAARLEHCLGKQLKLGSHPRNVKVRDGDCTDCCQVLDICLEAKHGCSRVQYNVRVTDEFPLPMSRTYAKLVSIDGCATRLDSNWVSLGLTPPSAKPFTVSQPVPCVCATGPVTKFCRC